LKTTKSYKRFIRIPNYIAATLHLVLFAFLLVTLNTYSMHYLDGIASLWIMGLIVGLSFRPLFLLANFVGQIAHTHMLRERINGWLLHRFSSYSVMALWVIQTPYDELDRLACLDDDSWVPLQGGGGILISDIKDDLPSA
jgi:hypothetical protein